MTDNKPPLARLVPVAVRDYWGHEALEFTPWLAQRENLDLLGQALELTELEVVGTEQAVGPFRADILCREIGSDGLVLIENQLGRTDHSHLGQIITYAAGLGASKVVWVAPAFTEEHRAALDWLNRITHEDFHCFGVQVELWRIGDSALAPRFHVVAKPNDWEKRLRSRVNPVSGPAADLHYRFWSQLRDHLEAVRSAVVFGEPVARSMAKPIAGPGRVLMIPWNVLRDGASGIWVRISGSGGDEVAAAIRRDHQNAITAALATLGEVVWFEADGKGSVLSLRRRGVGLSDLGAWPELNRWFAVALGELGRALRSDSLSSMEIP